MGILLSLRSLFGVGPPRLTIELVPSSCWRKNVRASVSPADWQRIRHVVLTRARGKCQVCRWEGRLHCHEVWRYQDAEGVQVLDGFVALCRFCHEVKHIGFATVSGRDRAALAHLAKVNGWSRAAAMRYTEQCFDLYERRSRRVWTQDLTALNAWLERGPR